MSVDLSPAVSRHVPAAAHANSTGGAGSPPRNSNFTDNTGVSLHVRPYEEGDFEALVEFYERYPRRHRSMSLPPLARSQIESWIEKLTDRGQNLLAFDGERLVGHVAYSPREPGEDERSESSEDASTEPELVIFVDEQYHNRGIGTELCKQAIAYAAADGHDSMKLNVDANNGGAIHVYKSLGFRTVDRDSRMLKMKLDIDDDVKSAVQTETEDDE